MFKTFCLNLHNHDSNAPFQYPPTAAVGAVFASSSCVIGSIRGKDGPLNHFLGGFLGGTILGARGEC